MKSVIFSTKMIHTILEGRKTQTRRVIKPQPKSCSFELYHKCGSEQFVYDEIAENLYCKECGRPQYYEKQLKKGVVKKEYHSSYNVGDILYVKETWTEFYDGYYFKANIDECVLPLMEAKDAKWQSPYYMPKEAARLFLTVTAVRVERLQDISLDDCIAEGIPEVHGMRSELKNWYEDLWDKLNAKRGYGWDKNPFVWVYEFERTEKPKE